MLGAEQDGLLGLGPAQVILCRLITSEVEQDGALERKQRRQLDRRGRGRQGRRGGLGEIQRFVKSVIGQHQLGQGPQHLAAHRLILLRVRQRLILGRHEHLADGGLAAQDAGTYLKERVAQKCPAGLGPRQARPGSHQG